MVPPECHLVPNMGLKCGQGGRPVGGRTARSPCSWDATGACAHHPLQTDTNAFLSPRPGKKVIIGEKPRSHWLWSDTSLARGIRQNLPDPESSCYVRSSQLFHSSSLGNILLWFKGILLEKKHIHVLKPHKMLWPFSAQLLSGRAWQNKEWQLFFLCNSVFFHVDRSGGVLQEPGWLCLGVDPGAPSRSSSPTLRGHQPSPTNSTDTISGSH